MLAADVVGLGSGLQRPRDGGCGVSSGFQETEQLGSGLSFLQMPHAVFWKCLSKKSYETRGFPDQILKDLLKPTGFPYRYDGALVKNLKLPYHKTPWGDLLYLQRNARGLSSCKDLGWNSTERFRDLNLGLLIVVLIEDALEQPRCPPRLEGKGNRGNSSPSAPAMGD